MADTIPTPVVQDLNTIIADLNPAYSPTIDLLNKERSLLPGTFDAQRMGLDAAKVQGFNQINNQATGRGMSFSGIPLNEQANYLSTQYLPGMQALNTQQNEADMGLQKSLAQIASEQRLKAIDARAGQQNTLDSWLNARQSEKAQAEQAAAARAEAASQAAIQRAWEAEQTKLQQEWEANQNELNRQSQLANTYAGRSGDTTESPTIGDFLVGAFDGYQPANEGGVPYYTERYIIPALMNNFGISQDEANNIAYSYRSRVFNEGAGTTSSPSAPAVAAPQPTAAAAPVAASPNTFSSNSMFQSSLLNPFTLNLR